MSTFPLRFVPKEDFRSGGLAFGNNRGKVEHAACDLIAPPGTPVVAVASGTVWYAPSKFFESEPDEHGVRVWTYELAVVHADYIARYGEISPIASPGIVPGAAVTEGLQIAQVGNQNGSTMLHFEMFSDVYSRKPLTEKGNTTYANIPRFGQNRFHRRHDLLDPTMHLNIWIWSTNFGWGL